MGNVVSFAVSQEYDKGGTYPLMLRVGIPLVMALIQNTMFTFIFIYDSSKYIIQCNNVEQVLFNTKRY